LFQSPAGAGLARAAGTPEVVLVAPVVLGVEAAAGVAVVAAVFAAGVSVRLQAAKARQQSATRERRGKVIAGKYALTFRLRPPVGNENASTLQPCHSERSEESSSTLVR
jgi:hypothetical protein